MHVSVPVQNSVEVIRGVEVSPFIAKCEVKVCYVGDTPNRNRTVITHSVAEDMGRKLPGSPIVGYYNEETKDFEEHNREILIKDGKFAIINTTRPYGFVPTDARVWFEKYIDDGEVEREYLVCEAYLWTQYPEVKRVLEFGNNHSMELDNTTLKGNWSGSTNSDNRFFIINEAVVETLCILGEDYEPCFEGSQIKAQFSLQREFEELKNNMYAMMNELKEAMDKGGSDSLMEDNKVIDEQEVLEQEVEDVDTYKKTEEEDKEEKNPETKDETDKEEYKEPEDKEDEEDKKKNKYNLDEIPEYAELQNSYAALEAKNSELESQVAALNEEISPLREFKAQAEKDQKQAMIDGFYMLSEEDKKDVQDNIDTYSLEDIEAKLSVICVRNRVNFNLDQDEDKKDDNSQVTNFSLADTIEDDSAVPAWIKAVQQTASKMD